MTRKSLITSAPSAIAHAKSASTRPRSWTNSRRLANAFDRPAVSPVLSASTLSNATPACDTIPVPSPVTPKPVSHPVTFTLQVLLDLAGKDLDNPYRSSSGALSYPGAPISCRPA